MGVNKMNELTTQEEDLMLENGLEDWRDIKMEKDRISKEELEKEEIKEELEILLHNFRVDKGINKDYISSILKEMLEEEYL